MSWFTDGKHAITFFVYLLVALPLAFLLGGVFLSTITSTNPFFSLINVITSAVSTAISTGLSPTFIVLIVAVVFFVGVYLLGKLEQAGNGGGGYK